MATRRPTLEAALDGLSESRSAEFFGSSSCRAGVSHDATSTSPTRASCSVVGGKVLRCLRRTIEARESSTKRANMLTTTTS